MVSTAGSALAAKCYSAMIVEPQPYNANGGELLKLDDGSIWKDIGYNYLYLYEYYPNVIICPDQGVMQLGEHQIQVQKLN